MNMNMNPGIKIPTKIMLSAALLTVSMVGLSACASLTNDAYVPMAISFSDGSEGNCSISNKRMNIFAQVPSSPLIRRSDDLLNFNCKTNDGRTATASVASTLSGKVAVSAFLDLGITDSITDKHRIYPRNHVINVQKQ